ncbi:hypothetical protein Lalb_Chr08g0237221 [Lupinus albus]|uniref:Uncharacterized protein n=1 Tax=Lupinus albus TaxID=3870 RepID=A0A6A4Q403_LUPAL|nr:hypothetical protein Lalb_Chr08g0237221 [Lupinus albus]
MSSCTLKAFPYAKDLLLNDNTLFISNQISLENFTKYVPCFIIPTFSTPN